MVTKNKKEPKSLGKTSKQVIEVAKQKSGVSELQQLYQKLVSDSIARQKEQQIALENNIIRFSMQLYDNNIKMYLTLLRLI